MALWPFEARQSCVACNTTATKDDAGEIFSGGEENEPRGVCVERPLFPNRLRYATANATRMRR